MKYRVEGVSVHSGQPVEMILDIAWPDSVINAAIAEGLRDLAIDLVDDEDLSRIDGG